LYPFIFAEYKSLVIKSIDLALGKLLYKFHLGHRFLIYKCEY